LTRGRSGVVMVMRALRSIASKQYELWFLILQISSAYTVGSAS
jgi:hypothetical protein